MNNTIDTKHGARADTVCAVSTPAGVGGIAVVRLSGSDAKLLAQRCLKSPSGMEVVLKDHRAQYAHLFDNGAFLDEVVATFFAAPNSYTGEDVVEISCHGSLYIQQQLLRHFVDLGARLAEPGEFTLRAFLNGRMNLSQAEAVADLIDSQSQTSHRLAVSQMRGGYAKELERLRKEFVDLAALMELELDFSDEDVEFANREHMKDVVGELTDNVRRLAESFKTGNALKNGVPVAIVGKPNVGKSTLLNALLHEERAIVSAEAGTTRDTIEEQFTIDGILFRLIDTAGIRNTDNAIEQAGIERSHNAMRQAAIIVYMLEASESPEQVESQLQQLRDTVETEGKTVLAVRNKIDILCAAAASETTAATIDISAKHGDNLDVLKQRMVDAARNGRGEEEILVTNARHYEALLKVEKALTEVEKGIAVELTPDLLVVDIRDALYHLGTITGKVTSDEILGSIFSRFCIGK